MAERSPARLFLNAAETHELDGLRFLSRAAEMETNRRSRLATEYFYKALERARWVDIDLDYAATLELEQRK